MFDAWLGPDGTGLQREGEDLSRFFETRQRFVAAAQAGIAVAIARHRDHRALGAVLLADEGRYLLAKQESS
ncbi:hypothetical protein WME88_44405 [Sorangium sp. So ce216]